jgi:hypothetical protein
MVSRAIVMVTAWVMLVTTARSRPMVSRAIVMVTESAMLAKFRTAHRIGFVAMASAAGKAPLPAA